MYIYIYIYIYKPSFSANAQHDVTDFRFHEILEIKLHVSRSEHDFSIK